MTARDVPPAATSEGPPRPSRRRLLLGVLLDLVVPIALYYGLRAAGVSVFVALLAGAVLPVSTTAVHWLRTRSLAGTAGFVAGIMLLGVAAALVSGSPRFMLAKDGWLSGAAGLWFLISIRAERPLLFHGGRPLLEGRFRSDGTSWDVLWEREPAFRRIWRVSTAIWGVAMLLDAVVRIAMAYTLPVDLVPGLGALLWPVTLVLLQLVNGVYYEVAGLWRLTAGKSGRSPDH
ncbi:VC0807 family protein [Streptomyces tateyamensis]|uniref:VC0807 family protein n=1 Tax=Streptomyces tateyamensis TaxID=565073 RepID=UPI0011B84D22|nr:VC0807 family protein [Streptomyces tateyamensis]